MLYFDLLGKQVKDVVTGFVGVVESLSYDLYGCVQAIVRPPMNSEKPGELTDGRWFDCKRLTVITDTPVMPVPSFATKAPGAEQGPAEKPARNSRALGVDLNA